MHFAAPALLCIHHKPQIIITNGRCNDIRKCAPTQRHIEPMLALNSQPFDVVLLTNRTSFPLSAAITDWFKYDTQFHPFSYLLMTMKSYLFLAIFGFAQDHTGSYI